MSLSPTTSTRGFTLMELLIVILIIGVLAGLLMPAVMIAKEASRKAKTRSIIANVAAGVERFRMQNGSYPDLTPPVTTPPTPALTIQEHLESIDADAFSPNSPNVDGDQIIDAWGTAIFYRSFEDYPFDENIADGKVDSLNPPNPDSFQIWSFGPNQTNDDGELDDINNWAQ